MGLDIIAVIIINVVFSFWQEYKAEQALEALKNILPSTAKVIRDNEKREILSAQLVPGDLLVLEEEDNISADARLVQPVSRIWKKLTLKVPRPLSWTWNRIQRLSTAF